MTKGLTKRIQALEKKVKSLEENKVIIRQIMQHLVTVEGKLLRLDIIQFALSKILVKHKLTTNKKIDKICNDKRKKVVKEREELMKKEQEKRELENNKKPIETSKKEDKK